MCAQSMKCRSAITLNQARESSELEGSFMSVSQITLCNLNICLSAVHLCSKCETELHVLFPPSLIVI